MSSRTSISPVSGVSNPSIRDPKQDFFSKTVVDLTISTYPFPKNAGANSCRGKVKYSGLGSIGQRPCKNPSCMPNILPGVSANSWTDIKLVASGVLIILSLSYFLIPAIYNKDLIKAEIKNHLYSKYKIELKSLDKINYSLLPKPHYVIKNLSILNNDDEIGKVQKLKVFISLNNFFLSKNLEIRDIVLNKTDFIIKKNDLIFFKNLLNTKPSKNKIIIKNSNIFYKNDSEEVLFINKIFNSKFYL